MFNSLNISASALTAQRLRMDVISSNIANASSTRGKLVNGEWEPYRRKMVAMEPREKSFNQVLNGELQKQSQSSFQGVRVTGIVDDLRNAGIFPIVTVRSSFKFALFTATACVVLSFCELIALAGRCSRVRNITLGRTRVSRRPYKEFMFNIKIVFIRLFGLCLKSI